MIIPLKRDLEQLIELKAKLEIGRNFLRTRTDLKDLVSQLEKAFILKDDDKLNLVFSELLTKASRSDNFDIVLWGLFDIFDQLAVANSSTTRLDE